MSKTRLAPWLLLLPISIASGADARALAETSSTKRPGTLTDKKTAILPSRQSKKETEADALTLPVASDTERTTDALHSVVESAFADVAESSPTAEAAIILPMDENASLAGYTFVGLFETQVGYAQLAEFNHDGGEIQSRSALTSYFARAGIGADVTENLRASFLVGASAFYSEVTDYTPDGAPLSAARPQEFGLSSWLGLGIRYRVNLRTIIRFDWELYNDVLMPVSGFAGDVQQWRMTLENRW